MRCLYCGKGIGPVRLLRDSEFCSEAHRKNSRERARQHLYEALAPEPSPAKLAEFLESAPVAGPAARGDLRNLSNPASADQHRPSVTACVKSAALEPSGYVLAQKLAAMATRPPAQPSESWLTRVHSVCRPLSVQTAGNVPAGVLVVPLTPTRAERPMASPLGVSLKCNPPLYTVTLPLLPRTGSPPESGLASVPLPAADPAPAVPEAVGPAVAMAATPAAPACTASVERPAMPTAHQQPAAIGLPQAATAAQHRPLEAGPALQHHDLLSAPAPLHPVVLPQLPAAPELTPKAFEPAMADAHLSGATAPTAVARAAAETPRPLGMPAVEVTLPTGEQLDSLIARTLAQTPIARPADPRPVSTAAQPRWSGLRSGPVGDLAPQAASPRVACPPAPAGSLAGLVSGTSPAVAEAIGNRQPHFALAPAAGKCDTAALLHWSGLRRGPVADLAPEAASPIGSLAEAVGNRQPRFALAPEAGQRDTAALPLEVSAAPSAVGLAPMCEIEAPRPAPLPAAAPACDSQPMAYADCTSIRVPGIRSPQMDALPALATLSGTAATSRCPGRAARSCAVLSTLGAAGVWRPAFNVHPVRVKFNDLIQGGSNFAYIDEGITVAARNKLLALPRHALPAATIRKWAFVGAAAAALLLAVTLRFRTVRPGNLQLTFARGPSLRERISQRAMRYYTDDFRLGLNEWKGIGPKWSNTWSYSTDGFVHPGQLALYSPSVPLSDYKFDFMAEVESKSVDWVVRAHDPKNYYAVKFKVVQPGPRPIVAMVRYPVVHGTKGPRVETPLLMMIHAHTPYHITVDVKGNRYRTFIEGHEADFWTEDRLKSGGVGFFSDPGEHARIYWVRVESHGDFLGRICGWLSGQDNASDTDKETQAMEYRNGGNGETAQTAGANGAAKGSANGQEARISRALSKAASLHLDGKLEEAAAELVRCLDGGERHPAVHFALGQLQYELEQYLPASQSYAQAALLQPLHPTAHFNAGVCLGRLERWEEAADCFRKAISNDPTRTEAHLALGACLVQMDRPNEAIDAYDRFLSRHPDHDEALFGKAVALQKRDRPAEAAELYRRILIRNPHSEEALSNLVSLSLSSQDYEQARKYAQRLAELQPKSQVALEGLAGAAFAAGDHQAAAEYSSKLVELDPHTFENWFNLGVACHKSGDLKNAAQAYTRAAKVRPDSPQAHLNLGVSLQEQGNLKGARTAYERALAIDPKLPGAHWNLGLVHEQSGDMQAAEKLYAQVPENSPDYDDALFRIGYLRLQRADYAGGIEAFEACLQRKPEWAEAKLNLGIAHWRAGDKDSARTCFQELTAAGTDSKEALRGLAALSLEHQDYDKAFEIYRQLLDSGDRSPELLYNAGLICQRRGQPEDAAVLYKEALKTDPQFGEALLNLGHALMSLGNEFEARSCWRKAVVAKPELAQKYFEPAQAS